jgi:phage I-like protein
MYHVPRRVSETQWRLFAEVKPTMLGAGGKTAWIHCAREGEWKGHHNGEFQFTRKVFERIVRNFKKQSNPAVLTYEHPDHVGKDGLAAGWIRSLDVREGQGGADLWAFVEFTPAAAEHVRAGEYRFCSVVVDFESIDRASGEEVGPELHEIGLTNIPFIDGLQPIQLSRRAASGTKRSLRMKKLNAAKALEALSKKLQDLDGVSEEEVKEAVAEAVSEAMAQVSEAVEEAAEVAVEEVAGGEAPMAEEPEEEVAAADIEEDPEIAAATDPEEERELEDDVAVSQASDFLAGLAADLGVDIAGLLAMLDANRAAVVGALSGGLGDPAPMSTAANVKTLAASRVAALKKQVADKDAQLRKLSQRVEGLESSHREREVDDAITQGLFLDKDRDRLVKLARSDYKLFKEWREDAKQAPAVPTGQRVTQAAPGARGKQEDDGSDLDPQLLKTYELAFRRTYRDTKRAKAEAIKACRSFLAGKSARA